MDPVADLQNETRRRLAALLPSNAPVALLDFPLYHNPGDALIYLGTRRYLQQLGHQVRYVAAPKRYDPNLLRRLHPDGPILLQGGGNFGDRWKLPQRFREQVIRDFPDRLIVQLPQGFDFQPGEALQAAQATYGTHSHLVVLIRDSVSLAKTQQAFPTTTTEFCPDLAMGFGYIPETGGESLEFIELKRADSESKVPYLLDRSDVLGANSRRDWGLGPGDQLRWHLLLKVIGAASQPRLKRIAYPVVRWAYERTAHLQVRSAMRILAVGQVVVTDRLHAAVLAVLMGKPVVALDNANGKISAMHADYLYRLPGFILAADSTDARGRLVGLLN